MQRKDKKILIISNMYPSRKYPHYGVFVRNAVNILRNSGYDCDVVYIEKTDGVIKKILTYICFYTKVIVKGVMGHYKAIYAHYASHTALPLLILLRLKKNLPLIMNVHGNDVIPETHSDIKYMRLVNRILHKANAVICPSEYFKKEVQERFDITGDKIVVYPSGGVDIGKFKKLDQLEARKQLGLDADKTYIGYVSRIEENKGWDIFLKAAGLMKNQKNLRWVVVGDGSQEQSFNDLINDLGIADQILKYDFLPQNKLPALYNSLDVFVFPTYRASESLGLVGLEAMACGVLTILPDKYGPSSYGKDGVNSIMFKSGDSKSLAGAIDRALHCEDKEIKSRAITTAKEYAVESTESILVACINEIATLR